MATFSSNTTIKINAATAISVNSGNAFMGTITAYTCPANVYAKFYLYSASIPSGVSSLSIAGQTILGASATYATPNPVTANFTPPEFILTPGQTIVVVDGNNVLSATLSGNVIEFTNTP
jgi:hypothetical protein